MDVETVERENRLRVEAADEVHLFDIVDEDELWYRTTDGSSTVPSDDVVDELERRGYVVTVDSDDATRT